MKPKLHGIILRGSQFGFFWSLYEKKDFKKLFLVKFLWPCTKSYGFLYAYEEVEILSQI